jgi:exodeoxyribonuclease V beta subunit
MATHYCLEMMNDFTTKSIQKAIFISQNKYGNFLVQSDFDDISVRINNLINNIEFQNMIKNSSYTKEQSLIFNGNHKIIDLLVKKKDKYIIVDYKTSYEKSLSDVKQVQNYVKAIQDITNIKDVEGYIVYLHSLELEIIKI